MWYRLVEREDGEDKTQIKKEMEDNVGSPKGKGAAD